MKKSRKSSFKPFLYGLLFGMAAMFALDMFFHFNNSVEEGVKREMDKAINKVEDIFK
jgi:hypothetical protein